MFVSSGTVRFPPATRRHRLAPSPGPLRAPPPIFSVDTHCSGIHFPPDSLQNPDLSLILRPFVIQKTGINNKLYMTESKWTKKKKKGKCGAPQQMVCFMVGKEKILLYGCSITSWCIFTLEMNNNKCNVGEICGTKVSGCHGDVAAPRLPAVRTHNVSCTRTADMWEISRLMSGCITNVNLRNQKRDFFSFLKKKNVPNCADGSFKNVLAGLQGVCQEQYAVQITGKS